MDNSAKLKRDGFSGRKHENQKTLKGTGERKTAPNQINSLREDRKVKNWLWMKSFDEKRMNYDLDDDEYAASVAAAAVAVHRVEEADLQSQQKMKESLQDSKAKSGKEGTSTGPLASRMVSRLLSIKEDKREAGEGSIKDPSGQASKPQESAPLTRNPITLPTSHAARNQKQDAQSKADEWKKIEVEKIRKRHERKESEIRAWEKEKKRKLQVSMDRKKKDLEKRKARASQVYQEKMKMIDQIANGARAKVQDRITKQEAVVEEKAKKMRSTGVVPRPRYCLCL